MSTGNTSARWNLRKILIQSKPLTGKNDFYHRERKRLTPFKNWNMPGAFFSKNATLTAISSV
jgi:hypothetical protein